MGIRGLLPYLRRKCPQVFKRVAIESFQGQTLALDGTLLLQKTFRSSYDSRSALAAWHNLLVSLRHHQIEVVCFFDGRARPSLKLKEYARRQHIRSEAEVRIGVEKNLAEHLEKLVEAAGLPVETRNDALRSQMTAMRSTVEQALPTAVSVSPEIPAPAFKVHRDQAKAFSNIELAYAEYEKEPTTEVNALSNIFRNLSTQSQMRGAQLGRLSLPVPADFSRACREMTEALGIAMYRPPAEVAREGEELASTHARDGLSSAVATEDTDALVYGASLLTGLAFHETSPEPLGQLVLIDPRAIREALDIDEQQFVDFCILCGSDYPGHIKGIGPVKGLELIKKHGDISAAVQVLLDRKHPGVMPLDLEQYTQDMEATRSLFLSRQSLPEFERSGSAVDEARVDELLERFSPPEDPPEDDAHTQEVPWGMPSEGFDPTRERSRVLT